MLVLSQAAGAPFSAPGSTLGMVEGFQTMLAGGPTFTCAAMLSVVR